MADRYFRCSLITKLMLARKEKDLKFLRKKKENLKDVIERKRADIKRKTSSIKYLEKKYTLLTMKLEKEKEKVADVKGQCQMLQVYLTEKQKKVEDTTEENDWLREMVQDKVQTKDDALQYTAEMKECVCKLLSYNVPTGQIASVIECVLKLGGKTASDLPTKSTVNDWNIMRLIMSQQQLAEELPQKESMGL